MRLALLFLMLAGPFYLAQAPPPIVQALPADYTAKREAALAPIFHLTAQREYPAALIAIEPVLIAYPLDLRVLFFAADIERISKNFDQALVLYQRCLDLKTTSPGVIHLGMVRTYADMKQWTEFNRERALVRQLALNGDQTLSVERGYTIEDYRSKNLHIGVLEFPSTDPQAPTRYRFLFLNDQANAAAFVPSIDLETNPADAASFAQQFPRKAAAHVRPFALASYPDAHTRAFIKFYPTGEPPYQDVHADVLALAKIFPEASAPATRPSDSPHRPPYKHP